MFERTRIKFCGLVREQDVLFAARLGVDALGLVFYPKSPRYLSLDEAFALRRKIPSYVAVVGLFVNEEPIKVREISLKLGLNCLQFHGDESLADIRASLPRDDFAFWKALRVRSDTDLLESSSSFREAEALLLDSYSDAFGGTGKRFDWQQARVLDPGQIILSGGLDAKSVGEGILALSPFAVDVSSGIQADSAREKSPEKMAKFMQAVLQADRDKAALN